MAAPSDVPDNRSRRPMSIARARALVTAIERRASRSYPPTVLSREDVERLISEASGLRLSLEADRIRTQRRIEALQERGPDEAALPEVERGHERDELLAAEIARLQTLIEELRQVYESLSRSPRSAPRRPPPPR